MESGASTPVTSAALTLYEAGTAYGSGATSLGTATSDGSTVAGEWALAQFTDSTGQTIGAPSTNTTGFENGASLAQADLADIASGGPAAL